MNFYGSELMKIMLINPIIFDRDPSKIQHVKSLPNAKRAERRHGSAVEL